MKYKMYINKKTGEIIDTKNFIQAFIYFIKDSRKVGYKLSIKDIKKYNKDTQRI